MPTGTGDIVEQLKDYVDIVMSHFCTIFLKFFYENQGQQKYIFNSEFKKKVFLRIIRPCLI